MNSQVLLNAKGQGNTYELINSVLAPGYTAVEPPDCSHTAFGRHIDEVLDPDLNAYVFRFYIHATIDNDRCINFDRQRNEIKTYEPSPANLKAVIGETVEYKWKFKLPTGFQSSSSFTHIHQLKGVGGAYEDMPLITLTTRKGTPDKLELRYGETDTQITLKQVDLTPFKGTWVEVTETIKFGTSGKFDIVIKSVSTGSTLFSYSNSSMNTYKEGATFIRPKWGIYRSLNNVSDLRDEVVLFANFSIKEIPDATSIKMRTLLPNDIKVFPNPVLSTLHFEGESYKNFDELNVYNCMGIKVLNIKKMAGSFNVSSLIEGLYFVTFSKNELETFPVKFVKQ